MDKTKSKEYFNQQAALWDDSPRVDSPEELQEMADRMGIGKDAWIVDIGTGTGVFLPFILNKLSRDGLVISVDFAIQMLILAQHKKFSSQAIFTCGEIENMYLQNEIFDIAICFAAFPHFHDKKLALENIYRILKPDGKLYICHTTSREKINDIHKRIPDLLDHLIPTSEEMEAMMRDVGFSKINIEEKENSYMAKCVK